MKEEIIKYTSYDGYQLEGTLLRVDNPLASVLFVHGITSSRDELGFHSDYAKFLGQKGISSLRFDYRYHGVSETSLENLTLTGIVNDIDASFNTLNDHHVGINNLFVIATSFGGGLACYWMDFNNQTNIRKIILNAPVFDYEDDVLNRNKLTDNGKLSRSAVEELEKKKHVNSSDIYFGRALINELRYINGIEPIKNLGERAVIFHGREDEDVPLSSSEKFKADETEIIVIEAVGHGFGVEDDEDLDFPETKEIHNQIYKRAFEIIQSCL